jgi:hypothetical protein
METCGTRKEYWSEDNVGLRRRWRNDVKIYVDKYFNLIQPDQNISQWRNHVSTGMNLRIP